MRKIIVCVFAISITQSSLADLGQKIEGINTQVKEINKKTDLCASCAGTLKPNLEDLMSSCIRSICPLDQASVQTEVSAAIAYADKPDSFYEIELQPIVDALVRQSAESDKEDADYTLKWMKTAPDLESPGYIRIWNLAKTLGMAQRFEIELKDEKFVVDQKKSRPKFSEVNDETFDRHVKIEEEVLKTYLAHLSSEHHYPNDDHAVNMMLYRERIQARARQTISAILSQSQKLQEDPQIGEMFKILLHSRLSSVDHVKNLIDEGLEVDTGSLDILSEVKMLLDVMSIAIDPARNSILDSAPIHLKKVIEGDKLNETLSRVRNRAQEILSNPSKTVSFTCQIAYASAQRFLPSEKEVEAFRRRIDSLKTRFIEQTKDLVCAADRESYQSQVRSWTPHYAITKERHRQLLKMNLQRQLRSVQKGREAFEGALSSDKRDQIFASTLPFIDGKEEKSTKSADDVCDLFIPDLTPDSAALHNGGFVVGPMPIRFPEAEGIVFHELGHHLLHSIENKKMCFDSKRIEKIRACLSSLHPENSDSRRTFYEAEDWSDLVSAGQGNSNKGCLYRPQSDPEEYGRLSLVQTDSGDPHSSRLFRLLHIHFVESGEVTPQCHEALAARGEKPQFKNCLLAK